MVKDCPVSLSVKIEVAVLRQVDGRGLGRGGAVVDRQRVVAGKRAMPGGVARDCPLYRRDSNIAA